MDFTQRQIPCKHMYRLAIQRGLFDADAYLSKKRQVFSTELPPDCNDPRQIAFEAKLEALPRVEIRTINRKPQSVTPSEVKLKYSNIAKRASMKTLGTFVAVDVETTGLSRKRDRIIEVAAIRFEAFEPVSVFTTLVNPEKKNNAVTINHITDEMLKGTPRIWRIMPALREYIGDLPIVGHNLPFDLSFLVAAGFEVQDSQKLYDTLTLAQKIAPADIENDELGTLCRHYQICAYCSHRAVGDALATGYLFAKLAAIIKDSAIQ